MAKRNRDKLTGKDLTNAIHFTMYRLSVRKDVQPEGHPESCNCPECWVLWETSGDRKKLFAMVKDMEPGSRWVLEYMDGTGYHSCASGTVEVPQC